MKKLRRYQEIVKEMKTDLAGGKMWAKGCVYELIEQGIIFLCEIFFLIICCAFTKYNSNLIIATFVIIEFVLCTSSFAISYGRPKKLASKIKSILKKPTITIFIKWFGMYGNVVSKNDWKNFKRYLTKEQWKWMSSRKLANGHCYWWSWAIAYYLKDAELLYCVITLQSGEKTGHSVILKNNCVFDTNMWLHCNYEEYLKANDVKIFGVYSKEEYAKDEFFDSIRDEFKKFCGLHNALCNPQ